MKAVVNKGAYIEHAKKLGGLLNEYGALTVLDCWVGETREVWRLSDHQRRLDSRGKKPTKNGLLR